MIDQAAALAKAWAAMNMEKDSRARPWNQKFDDKIFYL
jgi:hypothetical protein